MLAGVDIYFGSVSELVENKFSLIFLDVCKARNPCKNGATCQPSGDGQTCQCPANFQGEFCDKGKPRTLFVTGKSSHFIFSFRPFNGREHDTFPLRLQDCSHKKINTCHAALPTCIHFFLFADVNECAKNPCKNGATCSNTHGGYRCTCSSAFTGKNCDVGKKNNDSTHWLFIKLTEIPCGIEPLFI